MYLMDYETPSYRAFSYFINEEIADSVQDIFKAVMTYIGHADGVDLQHLYIDGSKFEANANKYTWVWKKATEKSGEVPIPPVCEDHCSADRNESNAGLYGTENRDKYRIYTRRP